MQVRPAYFETFIFIEYKEMVPTLGDLRSARRGSAVDRITALLIGVPFFLCPNA